jgi:hypothetical protein
MAKCNIKNNTARADVAPNSSAPPRGGRARQRLRLLNAPSRQAVASFPQLLSRTETASRTEVARRHDATPSMRSHTRAHTTRTLRVGSRGLLRARRPVRRRASRPPRAGPVGRASAERGTPSRPSSSAAANQSLLLISPLPRQQPPFALPCSLPSAPAAGTLATRPRARSPAPPPASTARPPRTAGAGSRGGRGPQDVRAAAAGRLRWALPPGEAPKCRSRGRSAARGATATGKERRP